MKKSKSGFTLLELLVVVGILAALVALALPFYQDYVNQSRLTAAEADLQTFKKALVMYDQLEPTMFTGANFLTLIGKYMQDYRASTDQTMPIDPWGNPYLFNVAAGAIWCSGPDGTSDVAANSRIAVDDDILVTWKPEFFVSSVRRVNTRTLEIIFSRKVKLSDAGALTADQVTVGDNAGTSMPKVSDTVFRVGFDADLPNPGLTT
ncbi:MAG: prepilin-type N-terminal cleavage/methylation domain-containing protein, partial [Candidatus Riflebacteria bacterium]|nr:prepilin-type N-terminal cleavage/methylation domain-containing protein [Candidatus Riflebacteria bacterium]